MNNKNVNDMLELRARLKRKMPHFIRQDFQIKKLKTKWIKAKGIHSKMRRKMAGHIAMPHPGFGSPKIVRGLNSEGLKEIMVNNVDELARVTQGYCAVISKTVGLKKKIGIIKKAVEMKIKISNVKDAELFIKSSDDALKKRKEEKKSRKENKSKQKEHAKKDAEQKKISKEEEKELKKKILEKGVK